MITQSSPAFSPSFPASGRQPHRAPVRMWVLGSMVATLFFAVLPISPFSPRPQPVPIQSVERVLLQELHLDGAGSVTRVSTPADLGLALSAVRARWMGNLPEGTSLALSIRDGADGAWTALVDDHDASQERDDDPLAALEQHTEDQHDESIVRYSDMLVARGSLVQLRATLRSTGPAVAVRDLSVLGFSAAGQTAPLATVASAADAVRIITRAEWGADESLRVFNENHPTAKLKSSTATPDEAREKLGEEIEIVKTVSTDEEGRQLTWPMETAKIVKKIVVHHTSSAQPLTPDEAVAYLRSVYFFHAITRGWGDIGYNYVIDPFGNVYEGRAGGAHVVGAHAANYNIGSIGISVMGTYSATDISPEAKRSLVALIHELGQKEGIDPNGAGSFRLRDLPNVIGHRDVGSTDCPGGALWVNLPNIRSLASQETVDASDPRWLPALLPAKTTYEHRDIPQVPDAVSEGDLADLRMRLDDIDASLDANGRRPFALHAVPDNPHILTMKAGEAMELTFRYVNDGSQPLTQLTYLHADVVPRRLQLGAGDGSIVARLDGNASVETGQVASFVFPIAADEAARGTFELQFTPVLNGTRSWPLASSRLTITIEEGTVVERVKEATVDRSVEVFSSFAVAATGTAVAPEDASPITDVTETVALSADPAIAEEAMVEEPVAPTELPPEAAQLPARFRPIIADPVDMLPEAPAVTEKPIRVHLSRAPSDRIIVRSAQPLTVSVDGVEWHSVPAGEDVLMTPVGDGVRAVRARDDSVGGIVRVSAAGGAPLEVANWRRGSVESVNVGDVLFRGTLELRTKGGGIVLINELPLEQYLAGLAEPNPNEPPEKIKALVIVARTYAMFYRDVERKFPDEPYDLNDDPAVCQKYLGANFEKRAPALKVAVDATRGQVVLYEGRLVKTPYFSASLGRTKSAQDVWGWTTTPYLVSVEDPCDAPRDAGHGVGLSGCGARVLAERGWTFDAILSHFYPGTTLSPRRDA